MEVIITRSTVADGKHVGSSKTPIELSDRDARLLIQLGKAIPAPEKPAKKSK